MCEEIKNKKIRIRIKQFSSSGNKFHGSELFFLILKKNLKNDPKYTASPKFACLC